MRAHENSSEVSRSGSSVSGRRGVVRASWCSVGGESLGPLGVVPVPCLPRTGEEEDEEEEEKEEEEAGRR